MAPTDRTLVKDVSKDDLQALLDELHAKLPGKVAHDPSGEVSLEALIRQLEEASLQLEAVIESLQRSHHAQIAQAVLDQIRARVPGRRSRTTRSPKMPRS